MDKARLTILDAMGAIDPDMTPREQYCYILGLVTMAEATGAITGKLAMFFYELAKEKFDK